MKTVNCRICNKKIVSLKKTLLPSDVCHECGMKHYPDYKSFIENTDKVDREKRTKNN